MSLTIGQTAPDFFLFNTEKEKVELKNYRGKNVLLLFFPFAFTGVCTSELCGVRDNYKVYEGLNAVVLGISVDSPHTLRKFKEENNLNFQLLSDFNKTVSEAYFTIYESFTNMELKGVSKRSAFVVDKEGVLRYAEVLENAGEQPNFTNIKKVLEGL